MNQFENLELSNNRITTRSATEFFRVITGRNHLKSLSLAHNVLNEPYSGKSDNGLVYTFEGVFSEFL